MQPYLWTNDILNLEIRIIISTVGAMIFFYHLHIFDSVLKLILEYLLTEEANLPVRISSLTLTLSFASYNDDDKDNIEIEMITKNEENNAEIERREKSEEKRRKIESIQSPLKHLERLFSSKTTKVNNKFISNCDSSSNDINDIGNPKKNLSLCNDPNNDDKTNDSENCSKDNNNSDKKNNKNDNVLYDKKKSNEKQDCLSMNDKKNENDKNHNSLNNNKETIAENCAKFPSLSLDNDSIKTVDSKYKKSVFQKKNVINGDKQNTSMFNDIKEFFKISFYWHMIINILIKLYYIRGVVIIQKLHVCIPDHETRWENKNIVTVSNIRITVNFFQSLFYFIFSYGKLLVFNQVQVYVNA